jgi:hypothetical protein
MREASNDKTLIKMRPVGLKYIFSIAQASEKSKKGIEDKRPND